MGLTISIHGYQGSGQHWLEIKKFKTNAYKKAEECPIDSRSPWFLTWSNYSLWPPSPLLHPLVRLSKDPSLRASAKLITIRISVVCSPDWRVSLQITYVLLAGDEIIDNYSPTIDLFGSTSENIDTLMGLSCRPPSALNPTWWVSSSFLNYFTINSHSVQQGTVIISAALLMHFVGWHY